jgi:DNA repair protein RadB
VDRIPLGCAAVDDMLDGGIENGCVTLVYGEAGAGKTNFCLQMARNVAREGKKVAYVDTEGVSLERLRQMCPDDFEQVARNILFFEVHDFQDQQQRVEGAIKLAESNPDVGLIVVDSMTMYYRLGSRDEERTVRNSLITQTEKLLTHARRNRIPVLLTSQVFTDIATGIYLSLGGHVIHHNAKTIIRLDKLAVGRRRAVIMKHRSLPEGRNAIFRLTDEGMVC